MSEFSGLIPVQTAVWNESFYVAKGEIMFGFDDGEMIGLPGTLVHLPAGTTH